MCYGNTGAAVATACGATESRTEEVEPESRREDTRKAEAGSAGPESKGSIRKYHVGTLRGLRKQLCPQSHEPGGEQGVWTRTAECVGTHTHTHTAFCATHDQLHDGIDLTVKCKKENDII